MKRTYDAALVLSPKNAASIPVAEPLPFGVCHAQHVTAPFTRHELPLPSGSCDCRDGAIPTLKSPLPLPPRSAHR